MKASWVLCDNHLALKDGSNTYHPNASDVYSIISRGGDETCGIECSQPTEDLPDLRFSSIGSPAKIQIDNDELGNILVSVYAVRNAICIPIDIMEGVLIDQSGLIKNQEQERQRKYIVHRLPLN